MKMRFWMWKSSPTSRVTGEEILKALPCLSFQFLFKQEDEFILHPQLGVIEQDGDIRNQVFHLEKKAVT